MTKVVSRAVAALVAVSVLTGCPNEPKGGQCGTGEVLLKVVLDFKSSDFYGTISRYYSTYFPSTGFVVDMINGNFTLPPYGLVAEACVPEGRTSEQLTGNLFLSNAADQSNQIDYQDTVWCSFEGYEGDIIQLTFGATFVPYVDPETDEEHMAFLVSCGTYNVHSGEGEYMGGGGLAGKQYEPTRFSLDLDLKDDRFVVCAPRGKQAQVQCAPEEVPDVRDAWRPTLKQMFYETSGFMGD